MTEWYYKQLEHKFSANFVMNHHHRHRTKKSSRHTSMPQLQCTHTLFEVYSTVHWLFVVRTFATRSVL